MTVLGWSFRVFITFLIVISGGICAWSLKELRKLDRQNSNNAKDDKSTP